MSDFAEDRYADYPDPVGAERTLEALEALEADWKRTVSTFAKRVGENVDGRDWKTPPSRIAEEFTNYAEEALSEALYHTRVSAEEERDGMVPSL